MAGAEREAAQQERLARVDRTGVAVAVAAAVAGGASRGWDAWLPVGGGVRLALADLPTAAPLRHPGEDAPILDSPDLVPHPIHDPARPYDEAVAEGEHSYARSR